MPYIIVNDRPMYLDSEARANGHVRVAEGSLSIECEDCSEDLTETGQLGAKTVMCTECESVYRILE